MDISTQILSDITVYMIDVAMGSDIPRKRGPAMMKSDILLVNKTDLAPHVDVDLASMERDLKVAREDRPYFLIQAKNNLNIEQVVNFIFNSIALISLLHRNKSNQYNISLYGETLYQFVNNLAYTKNNI